MVVADRFRGKVVLVTGAAHGIGQAIAERFFAEGASVAINDVDDGRAEAVAAAQASSRMIAAVADVSDSGQVETMVAQVEQRLGPVNVMVNNAALIATERHFLEADEAWWDRILAVNLTSGFLCARRVARGMAKRGTGVILNLSSGGATKAHRGNVAYDAGVPGGWGGGFLRQHLPCAGYRGTDPLGGGTRGL